MKTWRNIALILAVICSYQLWHGCTSANKPSSDLHLADCRPTTLPSSDASAPPARRTADHTSSGPPSDDAPARTRSFHGFQVPAWVMHLAPQPGESMRAYRDRIVPLAQLAIAPHRARVARSRDELATLDAHQRAELDGAVQEAATAIQDRVMNGFLGGELRPATFKPMAGVTMARDVLDIIDRGNTRFVNSLTPDQRTKLASHRFDFADYLVFSARWEDALHVLD
jgi:hypothetical protein